MRPYYTDPYTVSFDATAVDVLPREGRYAAVLDRSYFYPTSGGQEHDTGLISGVEVVDVVEEGSDILHVLEREIPRGKVHCEINWTRRFDNMQQHTGQHILSAAFENLFEIETISSRLGETTGTIDLSRQPTPEELEIAIAQSNKIVHENRAVAVHFADHQTLDSFKLRKPPKVEGTVRIIEVKDFDFSACGGTHCTHTSEVGVILTGNIEKVKSSLTRIEFFCGNRGIARYYSVHKSARDTARLLSTFIDELPGAAERLKNLAQEKDRRIKELSEKVLTAICGKLNPQLQQSPQLLPVFDLTGEVTSLEELRFVASSLSREIKKSFIAYRIQNDICQMNLNFLLDDKKAAEAFDELRAGFGAKGGGRNGFFSLTLESAKLEQVIEKLKQRLQNG